MLTHKTSSDRGRERNALYQEQKAAAMQERKIDYQEVDEKVSQSPSARSLALSDATITQIQNLVW